LIENSEDLTISSCPECGTILPNRLTNDVAKYKLRIYCEYYGALISYNKNSIDSESLEQRESKFSLNTVDMNNIFKKYIYRKIYVLLRSNLVISKKIENNLPLKKSNIRLIVNKLKKDLLTLKIPQVEFKKFSLTSQERFNEYLNYIKISLKSIKTIQKKDFELMSEAIEFVFNLL